MLIKFLLSECWHKLIIEVDFKKVLCKHKRVLQEDAINGLCRGQGVVVGRGCSGNYR